MKLLDRYILYRFLFNFFSSFVILMFIFIFQAIWLFIDDLAGKGLDFVIIGKFLFYLMPNVTEKVLPLTVLLSSILTFGTFAENYEFAAMKASGISLQRAMRSLIVFVIFLGGVTFFFANNVIPASEQKTFNLRRNIAKVKPAVAITEGVFSDMEGTGMNIKVDKKYGENDRFLDNVIIHRKSVTNINNTVIKAQTGELRSSESSDIIQLVLKDGLYYEDVRSKSSKEKKKKPFAKMHFETYTMNIDISELNNVDLEEDRGISTDKMKNISRLSKDIDSLKIEYGNIVGAFSKNITNRMGAFSPVIPQDTLTIENEGPQLENGLKPENAAITNPAAGNTPQTNFPKKKVRPTGNSIIDLYPEWQQTQVINSAKNSTTNILTSVKGKRNELDKRYKVYNLHILSLHRKYALAFSCIILFFVGAPLGAIIRKGGLGLPMVIAIVLFLVYYFLGVFAGNYSKEGNIHPMLGAWMSTLIMLPLGVFLTKRATEDKGLITFGSIGDFFRNKWGKDTEEEVLTSFPIDKSGSDYKLLEGYADDKVIDIIKNYRQYDYNQKFRATALEVLAERGISEEELRLTGRLTNTTYDAAKKELRKFSNNSDKALAVYLLYVVAWLVTRFVPMKESLATGIVIATFALLVLFLVFLVRSVMNYYRLSKILGKKEDYLIIVLFFVGMPIYFITYFFYKKKAKEEVKSIR